jgi:hypothetical protein
MPCKVDPPSVSEIEWLEHMLCQACRFLTKEQLMQIKGLDIFQDLFSWYKFHIATDAFYYKQMRNTEHTTLKDSVLDLPTDDEKKERAEKEVQRCKNEAKRLGLALEITKNYVSINKE